MSHEKENRSPTLDEFKARVREKFDYLKSEFGMREVEPELRNEFCVAFANRSTRVEVEGMNWGFGLQSYVGVRGVAPSRGMGGPGTPFWALLKFRAPESFEELDSSSRQLEKIDRHARLMREHIPDVLRGEEVSVIREVNSRFSSDGFDL